MARILPSSAKALDLGYRAPQVFWPRVPRRPEQTDAEKARDILGLISSGVSAASNIYGLGRRIASDLSETDAEKLGRLQREAVEQRARSLEPGRATLEYGIKPTYADPETMHRPFEPGTYVGEQGAIITPADPSLPGVGQRLDEYQRANALPRAEFLESFASGDMPAGERIPSSALAEPVGAPSRQMSAQEVAQAASAVPSQQGGGQPQFVTDAMERAEFGELDRASSALDTPENRAVITAAVKKMRENGREDLLPQFAERVRRGGADYIGTVREALGLTPSEVSEMTPLQRAGMQLVGRRIETERKARRAALPTAITAREFLDGSFGGDTFDISDLASSYGALMAQGREDEARQLLRLARGAGDYASFINNVNEPPELAEARARDAIKKGALPRDVDTSGVTIADLKMLASLGKKKRRASSGTSGRRRKPDSVWRQAMQLLNVQPFGTRAGKLTDSDRKSFVRNVREGAYGDAASVAAKIKAETGLDVTGLYIEEDDPVTPKVPDFVKSFEKATPKRVEKWEKIKADLLSELEILKAMEGSPIGTVGAGNVPDLTTASLASAGAWAKRALNAVGSVSGLESSELQQEKRDARKAVKKHTDKILRLIGERESLERRMAEEASRVIGDFPSAKDASQTPSTASPGKGFYDSVLETIQAGRTHMPFGGPGNTEVLGAGESR